MKITGKVEKEFNRTLSTAYVELSNVELSNPFRKKQFDFTDRQDERELMQQLGQIEDLRLYAALHNFAVEVNDIVEIDGTLEFVDGMWFVNCNKLISVKESSTHNERLTKRFREIAHATPVEPW
jgi:hypothetical protein